MCAVEQRLFLRTGSIHVAETPALVTTIAGSSVVVFLWSQRAAGICHFVLPRGGDTMSPRYGNYALPLLAERLSSLGATDLVAGVFGGSDTLGSRNVAEAMDFLSRRRIPVIRRDVGGSEARKLTFRTSDASTVVTKITDDSRQLVKNGGPSGLPKTR